MKVKRIQKSAEAILFDGSKASIARIKHLHSNVIVNDGTITLLTLDATIRLQNGNWFVKEASGKVGGYTEETFRKLFEPVAEKKDG